MERGKRAGGGTNWRAAELLFGMVALALICVAQESPDPKPASQKVVFVCEQGSVRIVIAAAYVNRLEAERVLSYEAVSRDHVGGAWRVVTFGCKPPAWARPVANKLLQWDDPVPPICQGCESARKVIVDKVDALLENLTAGSKAQGK